MRRESAARQGLSSLRLLSSPASSWFAPRPRPLGAALERAQEHARSRTGRGRQQFERGKRPALVLHRSSCAGCPARSCSTLAQRAIRLCGSENEAERAAGASVPVGRLAVRQRGPTPRARAGSPRKKRGGLATCSSSRRAGACGPHDCCPACLELHCEPEASTRRRRGACRSPRRFDLLVDLLKLPLPSPTALRLREGSSPRVEQHFDHSLIGRGRA